METKEKIQNYELDLIKMLNLIISRYEENTGNTVSDEMKALLIDYGMRCVFITCGNTIVKTGLDEHFDVEDKILVAQLITEKTLVPIHKIYKEAIKDYPVTWIK